MEVNGLDIDPMCSGFCVGQRLEDGEREFLDRRLQRRALQHRADHRPVAVAQVVDENLDIHLARAEARPMNLFVAQSHGRGHHGIDGLLHDRQRDAGVSEGA